MTNKENVQRKVAVMQAYLDDKPIQVKPKGEDWVDVIDPVFHWNSADYRIKPSPTYRPFKDGEELAAEFCKRFGVERKAWEMPQIWVRYTITNSNIIHLIYGMDNDGVKVNDATASLKYLFESYTFLDGSPCGVKEVTDSSRG